MEIIGTKMDRSWRMCRDLMWPSKKVTLTLWVSIKLLQQTVTWFACLRFSMMANGVMDFSTTNTCAATTTALQALSKVAACCHHDVARITRSRLLAVLAVAFKTTMAAALMRPRREGKISL